MSAPFEARFRSECPSCGWWIKPGDLARYDGGDEVVHVVCPEDVGLRAVGAVCGKCFTEKAANGSCGCDS